MPLLSCGVQPRQEMSYAYLLSSPDVASVAGLCPLLHGPQLCLLSKLSVGPDGGRGPQMHDALGPLRLLPPARSQQLGALPGGASLEPDGGHGGPADAGGGEARGAGAGGAGLPVG